MNIKILGLNSVYKMNSTSFDFWIRLGQHFLNDYFNANNPKIQISIFVP